MCSPRRPKKKFVILSGDCDYFNYNNMHFVVAGCFVFFFFFGLLLYGSDEYEEFLELEAL